MNFKFCITANLLHFTAIYSSASVQQQNSVLSFDHTYLQHEQDVHYNCSVRIVNQEINVIEKLARQIKVGPTIIVAVTASISYKCTKLSQLMNAFVVIFLQDFYDF